jgi:pyruvate dehydrogenase E2 component (dihydrolipoamide acetyltransferase)
MATEVIIPSLGEVVEHVTILKWFKSEGDWVAKGEPLLEVESEKVTVEIEAPASGILARILFPKGSKVPIAQVVAIIAARGERIAEQYGEPMPRASETAGGPLQRPMPVQERKSDGVRAAPVARKLAEQHGIDLSLVKPTGPHGTIMKKDVEEYLAFSSAGPAASAKKNEEMVSHGLPAALAAKEPIESLPIEGVRRVIFNNMYQSLSQTAQLTLHTEACAESLVALRGRFSGKGQDVSYNAILVKISAMALRLHPKINVSVEGDNIRVWRQVHIGLAMEAKEALIVPVVRNSDMKTIWEIEREIKELVEKTRQNKLSPDELVNGTFTLSNLGFADIDYFTPIIRPPESAILGVGRIVKKPGIKDDQVVPEARIGLSLTFDHRIIDGAPAARFLNTIKGMIEDPLVMIS